MNQEIDTNFNISPRPIEREAFLYYILHIYSRNTSLSTVSPKKRHLFTIHLTYIQKNVSFDGTDGAIHTCESRNRHELCINYMCMQTKLNYTENETYRIRHSH